MVKFRFLVIMLLLVLSSITFAKVTARVDRKTVQEGESFYLIVENSGDKVTQPNFEPLRKNFDVGSVVSGMSVGMFNGGTSYSSQNWKIMLIPKASGKFTIPSIRVGNEHTSPITVTVEKQKQIAGGAQDVFFESSISTIKPFVQQQIVYTMRFYFRYPFIDSQSRLQLPRANGKEMQLIEEPRRFMSNKNGINYQVFEFHYTLFAEQSGQLTISAPLFRGIVLQEDPMQPFGGIQRRAYAKGKEFKLNVKPIPASFSGKWWLPAKSVEVSEEWSKPLNELKAGEPVTRTITVRATGVSKSQLPELKFSDIEGLSIYPDKPKQESQIDGNNILSESTYTVAYVPSQNKQFTIPALTIPWWDTKHNLAKEASLPAHTLVVTGPPAITTPVGEAPRQNSPVIKTVTTKGYVQNNSHWFSWFVMLPLVLSGWVFGAIALYRTRNKRPSQNDSLVSDGTSFKTAMRQLKKACEQKDAQTAYHEAIKAAQAKWPEKNILNLTDMLNFISDSEFSQYIDELNSFRYAQNSNSSWNGKAFYNAMHNAIKKIDKKDAAPKNGLPPLYQN